MSKNFMIVALLCVFILGLVGLIGGVIILCITKDAVTGAVCIGLSSTAMGTIGGVLAAPKLAGPVAVDGPTQDLINFQKAVNNVASTTTIGGAK